MGLFNTINQYSTSFTQYSAPLVYIGKTIAPLVQRIPNASDSELERSLRDQFSDLINKSDIRRDVQFRIIKNSTFCAAKGLNFCKLGKPHILLAPKLHEVDKNAFSFLVRHELAHIKYNDLFTIPAVGLATYIALRFFIKEKISESFFGSYLTYLLPMVPMILFSRYREGKADEYAISHSPNEDLEGAIRFFEVLKEGFSFNADLLHPSPDHRIERVKNELIKRNHPLPNMEYGSEGSKMKTRLSYLVMENL